MRTWTKVVLIGACALGAMGAGHCEQGDALAFDPDACFSHWDASDGIRGPSALPIVTGRFTWFTAVETIETTVEVTNCGASLLRIRNGEMVERTGILRTNDVRQLHEALVDAGAGDATGYTDCGAATSGVNQSTAITFYEPSLAPGRAWANSFAFSNCSLDPRAAESGRLLKAWTEQHFGARR